ncbi:MAG TPA: FadR/GntR family transcriptional regulator [Alphaproteobacteria bacterium]|nr:FadR/GntR family transcriptional regulator [Alphaproteobacteria bacterium]
MTDRESPFRRVAPPRKRNLFSHVVEEVGSGIVRGVYKPGDVLPVEGELGRALGASRSVVREAIKSLAAKGLVVSRTRTGTRVLAPTHWNLLDLDVLGWRYAAMPRMQFFREVFDLRRMIEPAAAGLAAERAAPADIVALEEALDAMSTATGDAEIEADLRFHRGILEAAHNELVVQLGGVIGVGLLTSFRISPQSFDVFLPLHQHVFAAIRDRKPDAARKAMDALLTETRAFLEGELRRELRRAGKRAPEAAD